MSTAKRLLTLTLMTCVGGCSFLTPTIRLKYDPSCQWFEDQTLSDETKAWLPDPDMWPPFVVQDFNEIANNNDLYKQEC